ncbi:hypothetical protein CLV48_11760 [Cecembia rubra]|uniref:Uncharacterized protein n=1 Tax=Cecembia rubra TaxID=1485585 RepID=A0A2P8DPZ5_9BACT|nr:hypothetical protein CLV48_11760 [Cecembia rubra]
MFQKSPIPPTPTSAFNSVIQTSEFLEFFFLPRLSPRGFTEQHFRPLASFLFLNPPFEIHLLNEILNILNFLMFQKSPIQPTPTSAFNSVIQTSEFLELFFLPRLSPRAFTEQPFRPLASFLFLNQPFEIHLLNEILNILNFLMFQKSPIPPTLTSAFNSVLQTSEFLEHFLLPRLSPRGFTEQPFRPLAFFLFLNPPFEIHLLNEILNILNFLMFQKSPIQPTPTSVFNSVL